MINQDTFGKEVLSVLRNLALKAETKKVEIRFRLDHEKRVLVCQSLIERGFEQLIAEDPISILEIENARGGMDVTALVLMREARELQTCKWKAEAKKGMEN